VGARSPLLRTLPPRSDTASRIWSEEFPVRPIVGGPTRRSHRSQGVSCRPGLGPDRRRDARPNKRLFQVTTAGSAELERFAAAAAKPSFIRDDLSVKVQTADHVDTGTLIAQLTERAEFAEAKIGLFEELLAKMRGDRGEEESLRHSERIGPYLTCHRGLAFEQGNRDWCRRAVTVLRERQEDRTRP
jgi:hypothetical protein